MFFDLILLNRQHRAGFGYAWMAATRGIRHVKKEHILSLDIVKLCEDLESFVCSQSDSPRDRFSLRLSAILINGTIKIYNAKANYAIDDWFRVFFATIKPTTIPALAALSSIGVIRTPPSPILRKKVKKRRVSIQGSTPQSVLDELAANIESKILPENLFPVQEVIQQARADEITIRETQTRQEQTYEFGEFGIAPSDAELNAMTILTTEAIPLETRIELPVPQAQISQTSKKISSSSPSLPESAPVTLTVQAQIHVSAPTEPIPHLSPKPTQLVPELVEPAQRPLTEIKKRDLKLRKETQTDDDLKNLRIQFTKPSKKTLKINRCELSEVQFIDINPCPLPKFKLRTPNLTVLLQNYLVQEKVDIVVRKRVSGLSVEEQSIILQQETATPPVKLSTESIRPTFQDPMFARDELKLVEDKAQEPMIVETPQIIIEDILEEPRLVTSTPSKKSQRDVSTEQVMAIAAEERLLESPRKRRRLLDYSTISKDLDFITLPSELLSGELTKGGVSIQQESVESIHLPLLVEQQRQQDIVNKIYFNDRMTLEEISQKPINKFNIARAFGDILVLYKHKYVNLITKEDSCELKYIEKGPKLT